MQEPGRGDDSGVRVKRQPTLSAGFEPVIVRVKSMGGVVWANQRFPHEARQSALARHEATSGQEKCGCGLGGGRGKEFAEAAAGMEWMLRSTTTLLLKR